MIGLRIEGRYHWGYWVRIPSTSKIQPSFSLPPPTTLIGALSFPLIRKGLIKYEGQAIGESIPFSDSEKEVSIKSSSTLLIQAVKACSAHLTGKAMYWEDLNKYNTLLFQQFTRSTDEEKKAGGRRYLKKYLTGALPTGKVFYPDGGLVIAYLLDETFMNALLGAFWKSSVEEACWSITRVGSKESLFSVRKVDVIDLKETEGMIKTQFYFPSHIGEVEDNQHFYRENFWQGGWGQRDYPKFVEYIVPGHKAPIKSESIMVKNIGKAYEFGPEELLPVAIN